MDLHGFPVFTGSNLESWIEWLEDYFAFHHFTEDEKLNLSQALMEGDAYEWLHRRESFQSWNEMKRELWFRFESPPRRVLSPQHMEAPKLEDLMSNKAEIPFVGDRMASSTHDKALWDMMFCLTTRAQQIHGFKEEPEIQVLSDEVSKEEAIEGHEGDNKKEDDDDEIQISEAPFQSTETPLAAIHVSDVTEPHMETHRSLLVLSVPKVLASNPTWVLQTKMEKCVEQSEVTNRITHSIAHQVFEVMPVRRNKQKRVKVLSDKQRKRVKLSAWFKKIKVKIKLETIGNAKRELPGDKSEQAILISIVCIDKAKTAAVAASSSNKKSLKCTRREDAITSALEIENELLAKEVHPEENLCSSFGDEEDSKRCHDEGSGSVDEEETEDDLDSVPEQLEKNIGPLTDEKINFAEAKTEDEDITVSTSNMVEEVQKKDLHQKLVEKLGNDEHLQSIEGDLLSLRYMINDVIEEDGLQDLGLASNSENLDGLLRKLIDYYKNLVKFRLPLERDGNFCETRPSNADVKSGESLGTDEATSHGYHPELRDPNIVEATSRDIAVVETPDAASLTKDLDEALHVQKLTREEKDLYMAKQQSLVAENEALDKKIIELQEFLKQEEQKSASAREKLSVAVGKGKALVQKRDSLKQTIEEMNAELGRLKSEIINREERLLENEKKFRELESYTVRVEALESECQLLKNHLQETESILQERSGTLSMTLDALNTIDIGDEGDRYDPVMKLQRISQLFQNMSTAVSSAEQESRKSRRAAELLLAELNEVQERNDSLQDELSKFTYEIQQLSRQKDAAEVAKVEAISHFENLSAVNSEEKKKLYAQLLSFGTSVNSLKKILAGTNSCLADIFTMDMEFLHHLKANMESCAKQTGTNLSGWPQLATRNFVDKEIFSRLSAAWSNINLHEISSGGNITEICGSLSQILEQFVADVSHLEENVSKHLTSWHDQVNIVSNNIETFFKSIGTGTDSEIAALGERVSLLHGACSSVLVEIENRKAELVGNDDFSMSLHQVDEDFSSMESVRSMVNRLSSAVKELVVANAETVERNEKEMKVIIANLQRELHEKDIQNDRMCNELVGQVKEAQADAKIFAEDLQSASARMRDMQDQLGILVRERDSMKVRVKELQARQASHSELQEKVTSLSELLAAKDQEIEALMQALDEEESQMEDLKHRVTELEQEVQQKNLDLEKAEASRGKFSNKLKITVDKFDELHHLSESLLAEIEKLQQLVQDRDTEVSFLRQEVTRCTNEALATSQMGSKRDSEEIQTVLSWFDMIALLLGLEDSPSTDAHSNINHSMETLEKRIASMLSEIDELRLVGQSKDALLEAERSRVAELRQKEATLEKILDEKESQPNMSTSSTSEIVEVEPLINKWTKRGTSIPSQVRSLRKGNNDQVAISIDADQGDQSGSLDEDDDKAHGFRSLSTSRIVPRFTRPITNMVDGLWVSCDRTLMRQPALRLGIMIYWAILHALLATFVV